MRKSFPRQSPKPQFKNSELFSVEIIRSNFQWDSGKNGLLLSPRNLYSSKRFHIFANIQKKNREQSPSPANLC